MNSDIKLILSSSGIDLTNGNVSKSITSIEGNKVTIKNSIDFYNGTEPLNVEVEREIELNENDLARIEQLMKDLIANKEQNEQHNNTPIMDASFTISGGFNGVDFVFDNNIELYKEVSNLISEIIKEKEPDFFEDISEEMEKLMEETKVYGSLIKESENSDSIEAPVSITDLNTEVESEQEAKARLSTILGIPEEKVPVQFILMVKRGIDNFGPIEDVVTDVARSPRKFTDEEIKQYATEDRLKK